MAVCPVQSDDLAWDDANVIAICHVQNDDIPEMMAICPVQNDHIAWDDDYLSCTEEWHCLRWWLFVFDWTMTLSERLAICPVQNDAIAWDDGHEMYPV